MSKQITIVCLIIGLAYFFAALLIQSDYIIGWHNIIIIVALLAFTVASVRIGARNINKQIASLQNNANLLSNRIIANISHDFKTPLTAIIGYTQCVLDGYDGEINSEQKADLERVIKHAKNLSWLIDDVVDLAKVETGFLELSPSVFSLSECITDVIASLQTINKGNAPQLNVDIPDDLPPILADFTKVRRVLLNLLQNSYRHSKERIATISAREFDQYYAQVTIRGTGVKRKAEGLSADCDNGLGKCASLIRLIAPKWRPRNPLTAFAFSLSRLGFGKRKPDDDIQTEFKIERKKADLGLILAQKLVYLHTGSFYVEGEAGDGADAVFFTLPLATPKLREYIEEDLNEELDDKQREIASKIYRWLDN